MSNHLSSAFSPLTVVIVLFAFAFILVAGFLVWYALRRNDEVRAKFGHGKTIFEIETKKKSGPP